MNLLEIFCTLPALTAHQVGFGLEVDVQRLGAVMPEVMEAKNLIDLRRQWRDDGGNTQKNKL